MQKWFEDYQGTTDDPTGAKYVAKVIEDAANMAKPLAQAKMMADVMPLRLQLQEHYQILPFDAGWMVFRCGQWFKSQRVLLLLVNILLSGCPVMLNCIAALGQRKATVS